MNGQNDDSLPIALLALAGVIALILTGVLTLAVATTRHRHPPAATPPAAVVDQPDGRIYFATGSAALPPESADVLVRVADAARADAAKTVQISGYHDASGDAAQNAELAKNRALAVRHALEANGVAPDRLLMDKPIATTGGGDAREARRVELRLR